MSIFLSCSDAWRRCPMGLKKRTGFHHQFPAAMASGQETEQADLEHDDDKGPDDGHQEN